MHRVSKGEEFAAQAKHCDRDLNASTCKKLASLHMAGIRAFCAPSVLCGPPRLLAVSPTGGTTNITILSYAASADPGGFI